MITEAHVQHIVERHLEGTTHFLVAVELRPGNKLVVEVDNDRAITLNELAALNKAVRQDLGPEADDYEMQFSSPGMGRPFKVMRQYQKHLGRIVDITLNDGRALQGQLAAIDSSTLGLRIQHPSKVKGRLPKLDEEVTPVLLADIKSTKATITFN
jgi:ribosome maturation factor RimP